MSSAQWPHVVSGYPTEQCRYTIVPSLQRVLLDAVAPERLRKALKVGEKELSESGPSGQILLSSILIF